MFAVAALAACTTEQTTVAPQNEAIGFDTFVDNSTRATDITTENIANFGVYGTVTKGNSALIFDNTKVEKNGTAYIYSPAQYWIAAAEYDFLAFAPYQKGEGATWTYAPTNAQLAQNGTFSFNNETAAADQDVVYAYTTKTTEATLTAENTQAVSFTFKHILSKVAFSFTNTFTDGVTTLSVYNVKINNTAKTGTMAIVDGEDKAWEGVDNLVVPFGDQANAVNTLKAKAIANNNGTLKLDHHYVIPAERAYNITFDVDLYQAGVYLATYNHTINSTIDFAKNGNYVLSVKLAPESIDPDNELYPIEFTVNEVEDWDVESSVVLSATEVATADALKKAIAEGGDIRLTSDITLANDELVVAAGNEVNLDLNGNTLTVAALDPIDNYGKMTIANGKIVAGYAEETRRCIYNKEGGEMVINNVEFVQTYDKKGAAINNEGKMTINNAKVDAVFYSVWTSGANAETIINGGTYTSMNNEAIRDTWSYAVIALNNAKLIINGGTFTGNHGVVSATYGAEAILNAGTFDCTCTYTGNSDWVLYTGGDTEDMGRISYNEANCTFTTARTDGKIYYGACESYITKF